jgi:hypothetical protein
MNAPLRTLAALAVVLPCAAGCASRTAPFDQLDKAQITVLRLQGQEVAQPTPVATTPTTPSLLPPGLLPPGMEQAGQQVLQGIQQALPPGILPPGLIPGTTPTPTTQPQAQLPRFKGFVILAQMPLTDEETRDELLDIFGDEDSFSANRGNCFFPGMGLSMQNTQAPGGAPVELLVSLSCNQAMGDGFRWPYPVNGFTPETHQRLTKVYEKLWGPVPPSGA